MTIQIGERHDGDGRTARAIRHIRGAGLTANILHRGPGGLKMDSYRGLDGALLTVEDAYVDVYFTTAQIKALHATPMILVPAPGVGYYLEFVHAWLMLDYATAGLTEAADNLQIVYGVAAAIVASQTIECTGFIDQVADTYTNALPKIDMIATPVQLDNLALYLYNPNDEFGGTGGSVLRVRTHARAHQKLI